MDKSLYAGIIHANPAELDKLDTVTKSVDNSATVTKAVKNSPDN